MSEPSIDPGEYPFDVPPKPFIWKLGTSSDLDAVSEEDTAGRIPVLAVGSNASPEQLSRKFLGEEWLHDEEREGIILVDRVEVAGIDVVYAAHLAGYGSIPATVMDCDGATACVFLTWLTVNQFARMNVTEGLGTKYHLRRVDNVRSSSRQLDGVFCYVSIAGAARFGGHPLGLEEVEVTGSPNRRGSQREAWTLLAGELGFDSGRSLLDASLDDPTVRQRVLDHLDTASLPSTAESVDVLHVTGGTAPRHHEARNHPYVIVMSPTTHRRSGIRSLVEVEAVNGGRRLRCIAYVVVDGSVAAQELLMDQTLRAALGIQRVTKSGPLGFVSLRPLKLNLRQSIADKLSWIGGRRYLLLRVSPPNPPDIEKNLCRIQHDDLESMAIASGDKVLLLSPREGRLVRVSLQALRLGEADQESRNVEPSWSARYPDVPALLNIENRRDLRPIWMDSDTRTELGLKVGDAVLARRSLPTSVLNQLLDFGVVLLAAVLALRGLIPNSPVLAVGISIAFTVAIIVARLRSKLG